MTIMKLRNLGLLTTIQITFMTAHTFRISKDHYDFRGQFSSLVVGFLHWNICKITIFKNTQ